jgi:peptidoglycan/LPS O-acetylase OafA/YrhL
MMRRLRFLKTLVIGFLLLAIALWVSMLPLTILHTPVFIFSTTFFGHFFEFFAGIFIAMIVMKLEQRKKLERKGIRLTLVGTGGVVVLVAGMVFIYRQQPLNIPAIIVINNFLLAIPVAMMYLGLMREKSWLGGLLGSTLLRLLGRASYSFYLLHTIVIAYIGLPILQNYFPGRRVAVVIITFIATWIASILLYWFFEEPINKAIRKKTA